MPQNAPSTVPDLLWKRQLPHMQPRQCLNPCSIRLAIPWCENPGMLQTPSDILPEKIALTNYLDTEGQNSVSWIALMSASINASVYLQVMLHQFLFLEKLGCKGIASYYYSFLHPRYLNSHTLLAF